MAGVLPRWHALPCRATAVAYVASSRALDRPLRRIHVCELSMLVAFASPESSPLSIAALPELRYAAMATDVDAAVS